MSLDVSSAVAAARTAARALGLSADDAVILQAANRLAVRLLPCDVLVRVAPLEMRASAEFELHVALRLAETNGPIALLDPRAEPRVHECNGFALTFWRYHQPVPPLDIAPGEFAEALEKLHAGMRQADIATPHFTGRVAEAVRLVDDPSFSPDLSDNDREFLGQALRQLTTSITGRGAREQLLHGEPHPGNVLRTNEGILFIDLETCVRGPVEFDIAHAPAGVGEHYRGADLELVRDCQTLALAMVAAWRWDRRDQFPDGRKMGEEFLARVRAALGSP